MHQTDLQAAPNGGRNQTKRPAIKKTGPKKPIIPSNQPVFAGLQLAEAVGLAERHVSRQLRLAYLAPEVLKRLTCGREASAVSLYDLCFLAGETWQEQAERALCHDA